MKKHSFTLLFVLITSSGFVQANEQPQPPQQEAQQDDMLPFDAEIEAMRQASAARFAENQARFDAIRSKLAEMRLNMNSPSQAQEKKPAPSAFEDALQRAGQAVELNSQRIAAALSKQPTIGDSDRRAAPISPMIPEPNEEYRSTEGN